MAGYDTIPAGAQIRVDKFNLSVPEQDLADFKDLLRLSKLAPRTYENLTTDGNMGVSHEWMTKAKEYWQTTYDWRATEKYINSFPNFIAEVKDDDGSTYRVHFAALFSRKPDAVPVLFMHGWPGSHLEYLSMMDLFRKRYSPEELPYHIINATIPGYTLSSGPPLDKPFGTEDIARVINKMMIGLGFGDGYVSQGGDVGSFVSKVLAGMYDECKAIHLNFAFCYEPPKDTDYTQMAEGENDFVTARIARFNVTGSAYARTHGTRPATIGMVLSSSPLAVLAWIGEKFIEWSDETPPLKDILDSVTLYWFTQSFPRCIYPYRDMAATGLPHANPKYYNDTPIGYSWFPKEIASVPRAWVAAQGNLVWYRQHTSGGHFAAMEKPAEIMADIEDFVKQVWPVKK